MDSICFRCSLTKTNDRTCGAPRFCAFPRLIESFGRHVRLALITVYYSVITLLSFPQQKRALLRNHQIPRHVCLTDSWWMMSPAWSCSTGGPVSGTGTAFLSVAESLSCTGPCGLGTDRYPTMHLRQRQQRWNRPCLRTWC